MVDIDIRISSHLKGADLGYIDRWLWLLVLLYNQELISAMKWCKGVLNLRGLLVVTVVKRCYALFTI